MFLKLIHLENKIVLTFSTPYRLSVGTNGWYLFFITTLFLYMVIYFGIILLLLEQILNIMQKNLRAFYI